MSHMQLASDAVSRLDRARASLEGLSVGDAFGVMYFVRDAESMTERRLLFAPTWPWTDDTQMALSLFEELIEGQLDQDRLAANFARRYDPRRGYGPSMNGQLRRIREGEDWRDAARSVFGGQGTFGNGAAMRVAPLGAYFADDLETVVQAAVLSAEVTHAHPEGIAGAVAVAVGAAVAARHADSLLSRADFLEQVLPWIPEGEVAAGVRRARALAPEIRTAYAAAILGNGSRVSAQDTVPFCLWCAGGWLQDYEEALWQTVSAGGDRDTNCAIVGGMIASGTGIASIPREWREAREPLR